MSESLVRRLSVSTEPIEKAGELRAWLKRGKLAQSPFNYFRGVGAEFYAHWATLEMPASPLVWSCGDVHVKNVGTFRADNGLAYFDLDDFDDCCLAPANFDLGRAATGLLLSHGAAVMGDFLAAYARALSHGKPYHIEAASAEGPAKLLLDRVGHRTQKQFVKKWVVEGRIAEIPEETYRLPAASRQRAQTIFEEWAKRRPDPKYYRVLDVCGSTAGIGSLTVERYLVLVRGGKRPHILDMKQATPSALASALRTAQPKWKNEAQRVAEVQRFLQYMPVAHLGWTDSTPVAFVLTEFQPAEDRMESLDLSEKMYAQFVQQWGSMVAWSHLRASGWKDSPPTDALIEFGRKLNRAHQQRIRMLAAISAKAIAEAQALYAETVLPEKT